MAYFNIPYQNLSFNLPDEGQVFRTSRQQSAGDTVIMRRGGSFITLPQSKYQGDINALSELLITGEMESAMGALRGRGQRIIEGTPEQFINPQVRRGEVFTQNISPINPHQADITSNLLGNIRTATQTPQAGAFAGDILGARAPVIPPQPAKPVSILSSNAGKRIATQNEQKLLNIEQGIKNISGDIGILSKAKEKGMDITGKTTVAEAQKFLDFSGSPTGQVLTNQLNQAASEGLTDPDKDAALTQRQNDILSAISAARGTDSATEKNSLVNMAISQIKEYQTDLKNYLKDIAVKRADAAKLALPGEKEKQLSLKANNLKTEIEQIKLANDKRKFEEYEAQTAPFAARRGQEFDIRTSFEVQQKSLELSNILGEFGIEQGTREMQMKSAEQALDDFKSDYELQNKVNDKITEIENKVIDKAAKLTDESRDYLGTLLDDLKGVNPNEMSPETIKKLKELSEMGGIPYSITEDALKVSYQKQVFEDNIKTEREELAEARLSLAEEKAKTKKTEESSIFSKEEKARLKIAGVDEDTSQNITRALLSGIDLDKIRETLRKANLDPALLDKYDRAVGIEKVRSGMLKKEKKEEENFLSKDYLKLIFTDEQLKKSAEEAGLRKYLKKWKTEKENYLNYLMNIIEQYRKSGLSDKEIFKQLQ